MLDERDIRILRKCVISECSLSTFIQALGTIYEKRNGAFNIEEFYTKCGLNKRTIRIFHKKRIRPWISNGKCKKEKYKKYNEVICDVGYACDVCPYNIPDGARSATKKDSLSASV
jgi:hypothetical protein